MFGLQYAPPLTITSLLALPSNTDPSARTARTPTALSSPSASFSMRTLSTCAPVRTVTLSRLNLLVMKSAPVVRSPSVTVRGTWPQPCGFAPCENMSWSSRSPLDSMDSRMRSEMGARSCGSVPRGPSYPCAASSALNHGLPLKDSACARRLSCRVKRNYNGGSGCGSPCSCT